MSTSSIAFIDRRVNGAKASVSIMLDISMIDADANALQCIAAHGASFAFGEWQYRIHPNLTILSYPWQLAERIGMPNQNQGESGRDD